MRWLRVLTVTMVTILAVQEGWKVTFDVDADNVGVRLVTWCYSGKPYQNVNYLFLDDSGIGELTIRRESHPGSSNCTIFVDVMRQRYDEKTKAYLDPSHDYEGESTAVAEDKIPAEVIE